MEINKDELRQVYGQWSTEKIVHILTYERDQFEDVAIELMEEELTRRNVPLPSSPLRQPPPIPTAAPAAPSYPPPIPGTPPQTFPQTFPQTPPPIPTAYPQSSPTPPPVPTHTLKVPPPPPQPHMMPPPIPVPTSASLSTDPAISSAGHSGTLYTGPGFIKPAPTDAALGTMYTPPGETPEPKPLTPQQKRNKIKADADIAASQICFLCQGSFTENEDIIQCNKCNGYYHAKCWTDDKGCIKSSCREEEKKMKRCPLCGEPIQTVAVKCKHCGEYLNQSIKPPIPQEQVDPDLKETIPEAKHALIFGIIGFICCGLGFIFGPIAIYKGIKAQDLIKTDPYAKGKEIAIVGIVLGGIGSFLGVLNLILRALQMANQQF